MVNVDLVPGPDCLDQSIVLLAQDEVLLDEALVLLGGEICGRCRGT